MSYKKFSLFMAMALLAWPAMAHAADIVGTIFGGLDQIVAFFLDFFTGGAMTIVGAIMFFIMLLGKILMFVGLTFGPLLLALAPFRLTRNLALKWGEYMFGAMMYTGVATVVVMLCSTMFSKLHEYGVGQTNIGLPATYISLISIMIAAMAGMIMWRVPSITAELFGGMGLHTRAPRVMGKGGGGDKTHEKLDKIIKKLDEGK